MKPNLAFILVILAAPNVCIARPALLAYEECYLQIGVRFYEVLFADKPVGEEYEIFHYCPVKRLDGMCKYLVCRE